MIEDTSSMCQEQVALSAAIDEFVAALADRDLRMAVVTTALLDEEKRGRFNTTPATAFPPACQESRVFPAQSDLHCECAACAGWEAAFADQCGQDAAAGCVGGDPGQVSDVYRACLAEGGCANPALGERAADAALWTWEAPFGGGAATYNLNGSVNSSCRFECGRGQHTEDDARAAGSERCRRWFEDDTLSCQVPDLSRTGCVRPPATAGCKADLPAVLPAYDADGAVVHGLDALGCLVTVGADQTGLASLEHGLGQAWLALGPDGPHT